MTSSEKFLCRGMCRLGIVVLSFPSRCATTCLIVVLGSFYPSYLFFFQLLIALDISSHWIETYSSLLHGETMQEVIELWANPVMRVYYMRPVLFTFCAGNELFFASLYFLYFTPGSYSKSLEILYYTVFGKALTNTLFVDTHIHEQWCTQVFWNVTESWC